MIENQLGDEIVFSCRKKEFQIKNSKTFSIFRYFMTEILSYTYTATLVQLERDG